MSWSVKIVTKYLVGTSLLLTQKCNEGDHKIMGNSKWIYIDKDMEKWNNTGNCKEDGFRKTTEKIIDFMKERHNIAVTSKS